MRLYTGGVLIHAMYGAPPATKHKRTQVQASATKSGVVKALVHQLRASKTATERKRALFALVGMVDRAQACLVRTGQPITAYSNQNGASSGF